MLGIVILNYQKWEETVECIQSIIDNRPTLDEIAICIVDNNSTTAVPSLLTDIIHAHPYIDLLKLNGNRGYAYGNNRGWEFLANKYQLDYVIISNSDIVFYENSLQKIIEFYKAGGKGISFPKILSPNGKVSYIDKCYYKDLSQVYRRILYKRGYFNKENAIDMDNEHPVRTNLNMGACFVMDRMSMDRLLPLDENTTLYFEEMILSYKADKAGVPITYVPYSVVLHKEGRSTGKNNPFAEMCRDESVMYYSRRYIGANRISTFPLFVLEITKFWLKSLRDNRYKSFISEHNRRLYSRWMDKQ